jgi:SPP1 gp7 family putative phage head morphogenesis protein
MAFKLRSFSFDTLDAKTIKGNFKPSSNAERDFYRALKKVASVSGHIVDNHVDGVRITDDKAMQKALNDYAKLIGPWAERQAKKMLDQVKNSNKRAYEKKSKLIGTVLKSNLSENSVDQVAIKLLNEQVALIKSIPIEAGLRAQKIAYEASLLGVRAEANADTIKELQDQLGLSLEVATSRAQLIAITETARATASINQARAMSVGSNKYRWHNSGDGAVRDAHKFYKGKRMQGQIFSWDDPPTLDDGTKGHPGTFPRCRCFAEPVFDSE